VISFYFGVCDVLAVEAEDDTVRDAVSSHVATDKDPSKFRSNFSDNLQPIATRRKIARGTLLVDIGCSSERAPHPLVITTKLAAAIYGGAANNKYKYSIQYCPCARHWYSVSKTSLSRQSIALVLTTENKD